MAERPLTPAAAASAAKGAGTVGAVSPAAAISANASRALRPAACSTIPTHAGVAQWAAQFTQQLAEWGALFGDIPSDDKRRNEALAGALKLKKAAKQLEPVTAAADDADPEPLLMASQAALQDAALGMLDLTYPAEERLSEAGFAVRADVDAAIQRLDLVVAWSSSLIALFKDAGVDTGAWAAKNGHQSAEQIPAELREMLAKAAREQQKKAQKEKAEAEAAAAAVAAAGDTDGAADSSSRSATVHKLDNKTSVAKQRKAAWGAGVGLNALFLGADLWEALCWRRGSIRHLFLQKTQSRGLGDAIGPVGDGEKLDPEPESESPAQEEASTTTAVAPASTGVSERQSSDAETATTDTMSAGTRGVLMAEAVGSLELMLRAQGPLESDEADVKLWRNGMVKGEEETKELHSHGIYSSTHLLALKVTAELRYWMWRDAVAAAAAPSASGSVEVKAALDSAASQAKRTLHEYVHICDDIMPGRGASLTLPDRFASTQHLVLTARLVSCPALFDFADCGANVGWTARGEAAWLAEVEGDQPEADAAATAKAGRAAELAGGGGGRGGGKKKKGKKGKKK